MNAALFVLFMLMVVWIYRQYQRDVNYKTHMRDHVFDECLSWLEQVQITRDKANLPVLKGYYAGYQVALSIVEDTLGWRKLPPLWLLIKVTANMPSFGTLDFIVRPSNNEFYSPSWQWNGNLPLPPTWPQHAILKYQHHAINVAWIESHVPKLFLDAKMKELLVTPTLVRLTYMVKQAERGEYLIMRNAVYENTPINGNEVEALLKQAVEIRQNLEDAQAHESKVMQYANYSH